MPDHPIKKQHRLEGYNYSAYGSYLITFNTTNRAHILSEIISETGLADDARPKLTDIGRILDDRIIQIPEHYENVRVDSYVIMPDHVHILLTFLSNETEYKVQRSRLSRIVHSLKRLVTKELGHSVWQLDYYDCISFSDREYDAFWDYVACNPSVWFEHHGKEAPLPQGKQEK